MLFENKFLHNNEEKLNYVIKKLNLKTKDIAQKLEISSGLISQIQNHYNGKLRKIHLYAICNAYKIPMEIFENKEVNNTEVIDGLLEQTLNPDSMFQNDYKLLNKLLGTWYVYSYPSNLKLTEVWITETKIFENFHVEDMHKNTGKLYIGKKQSIILKESNNSRNITSITFDNDRITYENFPFSRVSKSNSLNKELFNFGFFSRIKMSKEEAKEVLGNINEVQVQMNYGLLERINSCIETKG
jgi:transcriptional regulator with XRE-family HTH domain